MRAGNIDDKLRGQKDRMIKGIFNKNGQEEIIGFVVIIAIVSVIILILLGFFLKKSNKEAVGDYEIDSFIGASLQYTTDCEDFVEFLPVQEIIYACDMKRTCLDKKDSCQVLNETIADIIEEGWNVNEQSAVKGYKFTIMSKDSEMLSIQKGNLTGNYKGGFQDFAKGSNSYEVSLSIYY